MNDVSRAKRKELIELMEYQIWNVISYYRVRSWNPVQNLGTEQFGLVHRRLKPIGNQFGMAITTPFVPPLPNLVL